MTTLKQSKANMLAALTVLRSLALAADNRGRVLRSECDAATKGVPQWLRDAVMHATWSGLETIWLDSIVYRVATDALENLK